MQNVWKIVMTILGILYASCLSLN